MERRKRSGAGFSVPTAVHYCLSDLRTKPWASYGVKLSRLQVNSRGRQAPRVSVELSPLRPEPWTSSVPLLVRVRCCALERKSLFYFRVNLMQPVFGALRPIVAGSELVLQLRDAIPGGAQLVGDLLSRFYHVLGVSF